MRLKDVKEDLYLYHMTDICNLQSIIDIGLCPRNILEDSEIDFNDIANHEILNGRSNLRNYVPFHFHPFTSFDYIVRENNKDKDFIYLCISRKFAKENNFKILPEHPLSLQSEHKIFNYNNGIQKINWDIMSMKKDEINNNNIDENIAKQIKMAECLSPNPININDIDLIIVKDYNILNKARAILNTNGVENCKIIVQKIF